MTILNKFLIFNKKTEIKKCSGCNGTGKIELSGGTSMGTQLFYSFVVIALVFSLMDMAGSTPNYFVSVPLFIGSAILGMVTLVEYKQHTKQKMVENTK